MHVKNVLNPYQAGTIIFPGEVLPVENTSPRSGSTPPLSKTANFMAANGYHGHQQNRRRPTAVTSKEQITVVTLACHRNSRSSGFLRTIFDQLERFEVSVDLVAISEKSISVAVQSSKYMDPMRELASEMEQTGKVSRDGLLVWTSLTEPAGTRLHIRRDGHHLRDWPQDEKHGRRSSGDVLGFGCCEDQHSHD